MACGWYPQQSTTTTTIYVAQNQTEMQIQSASSGRLQLKHLLNFHLALGALQSPAIMRGCNQSSSCAYNCHIANVY